MSWLQLLGKAWCSGAPQAQEGEPHTLFSLVWSSSEPLCIVSCCFFRVGVLGRSAGMGMLQGQAAWVGGCTIGA